jgi:hypothetical protein
MKRIARSGFGIALLGLLVLPVAQAQSSTNSSSSSSSSSSDSSLGDYARQVRKTPASKPKVYDNDNLPTNDKLSVVGPPAGSATDNGGDDKTDSASASSTSPDAKASGEAKASGDQAAGKSDSKPAEPPIKVVPKTAEEEAKEKAALTKQWEDKLTSQKDQIDLLNRELDVLQREYQIRAAAMYADAGNRMRNSADWDKQDAQYKQQIADKQKEVEDAKTKMDDMQEGARKAGVSASARESATTTPAAQ